MSRYRHEIDNARAHIVSLWLVIILLAIGLAFAFRGWANAPSDITLHIPPDLSVGSTVRVGEIPKPNVYGFGYYMWQQLNRWPQDGAEDFPAKLYRFAAYVTPVLFYHVDPDRDPGGILRGNARSSGACWAARVTADFCGQPRVGDIAVPLDPSDRRRLHARFLGIFAIRCIHCP